MLPILALTLLLAVLAVASQTDAPPGVLVQDGDVAENPSFHSKVMMRASRPMMADAVASSYAESADAAPMAMMAPAPPMAPMPMMSGRAEGAAGGSSMQSTFADMQNVQVPDGPKPLSGPVIIEDGSMGAEVYNVEKAIEAVRVSRASAPTRPVTPAAATPAAGPRRRGRPGRRGQVALLQHGPVPRAAHRGRAQRPRRRGPHAPRHRRHERQHGGSMTGGQGGAQATQPLSTPYPARS